MLNRPSQQEILQACEQALSDEIRPQLPAELQFKVRIVCNLLRTLMRECEQAEDANAREVAQLQELLGSVSANLEELNRALSLAIRSGDMQLDNPKLHAYLLSSCVAKLQIDNPRYTGIHRP